MKKIVLLILILFCLFDVTGCSVLDKEITKLTFMGKKRGRCYSRGKFKTPLFKITDSEIEDLEIEGVVRTDRVIVSYQRDLQNQAEQLNKEISSIIHTVEDQTGIELWVKPRIYLIRVDVLPQNIEFEFNST